MTDNEYDHFNLRKSGAEHLADATAAAGEAAPPPHPETLNFNPIEVSPGIWQLPNETNTHRFFRTNVEARHAGLTAEAKAQREYANYVNELTGPVKTAGQEINEAYEVGKAKALSEGISPEAWAASVDIRAAYMPDTRTGAELMQEHKRNRN